MNMPGSEFREASACVMMGCNEPREAPGGLCAKHKEQARGPEHRDDGKPPIHLVPRELIEGAARAYAFGAKKYAAFNYRKSPGIKLSKLADSALRHLIAWAAAEESDPESGLVHLDHAAASLGMLMDTYARVCAGHLPKETDDRWKESKTT